MVQHTSQVRQYPWIVSSVPAQNLSNSWRHLDLL
ncbi:Hypothetical protein Bdt_2293 [Bdellovibrio bacteriovorus str. Tiberius]|uniref:Uncharacterized protein n=1 Tax=Bdellovibrio bacteriovorus str. Tiberius TaxID=1069642 RepID=K7YQ77_BDEBC|nr:Hypothetical protein Bdt_2293 [Bdellovibrio bacteriovorus str. Tiberius]